MDNLTPEQKIDKLRSVLTEAVDKHLQAGGKIISGSFGRDDHFCPIRCAVNGHIDMNKSYEQLLSQVLGFEVSERNTWDFVDGFDGAECPISTRKITPEFELGRELRARYIQEKK